MNKYELQITEYDNIRVLTTQQIAELYDTSTDTITKNFNRNKERYTEGKHYICLDGDELKRFKTNGQIDLSLKINKLYLWTEKGALLHAKSLNTDKAWEVYDYLVENYFRKQEVQSLSRTELLSLAVVEAQKVLAEKDRLIEEKNNRIEEIEEQLDASKDWYSIKRVAALNGVSWKTFDWRRLKEVGLQMGYDVKKIFDANYGEVNTYHRSVWEAAYPKYEV
jgi:hypothetical protein